MYHGFLSTIFKIGLEACSKKINWDRALHPYILLLQSDAIIFFFTNKIKKFNHPIITLQKF